MINAELCPQTANAFWWSSGNVSDGCILFLLNVANVVVYGLGPHFCMIYLQVWLKRQFDVPAVIVVS